MNENYKTHNKNIENMRPTPRYWYLRDNNEICPHCKKTLKLSSFYNKDSGKVKELCKRCDKKQYEAEITKQVLSILTKMKL